jgi:hypothetical protein
MPYLTLNDGTEIYDKDWGAKDAQFVVFSHGWTLTSSNWEVQMFFLAPTCRPFKNFFESLSSSEGFYVAWPAVVVPSRRHRYPCYYRRMVGWSGRSHYDRVRWRGIPCWLF